MTEITPRFWTIRRLLDGNRRYVNRMRDPRRRDHPSSAHDPEPVAALVACSDLGVDPDDVFDLAPGGLFVMQTAGHVVSDGEIAGSLLAHRSHGIGLVVVLGHSPCGVVDHCIGARPDAAGFVLHQIRATLDGIVPPHSHASTTDILGLVTQAHAVRMATALRKGLPSTSGIVVIAAHLDESSGAVRLLPDASATMSVVVPRFLRS